MCMHAEYHVCCDRCTRPTSGQALGLRGVRALLASRHAACMAGPGINQCIHPADIGAVQPCVETAYREGHICGSVLDLGCGQGDIAIYLAAQGLKVSMPAPSSLVLPTSVLSVTGLGASQLCHACME